MPSTTYVGRIKRRQEFLEQWKDTALFVSQVVGIFGLIVALIVPPAWGCKQLWVAFHSGSYKRAMQGMGLVALWPIAIACGHFYFSRKSAKSYLNQADLLQS